MVSDLKGSKVSAVLRINRIGGFGHDSADAATSLPTYVSEGVKNPADQAFRRRSYLGALDATMYVGRYVLIAADNTSPARVATLDEARAAVGDGVAATVAGTLADGLLGADIDAEDPIVGDACAEALIAWCVSHDLPYIVRDSGRAGGRHVIAVVTGATVPVAQWTRLCHKLSRIYGTVVQDRTGQHLRLLSAPHRIGLPSPVLACTATPAAVMDAVRITRTGKYSWRARRGRDRPGSSWSGETDHTRSAREYGQTCAMARAGYTARQAWGAIAAAGGKAAGRGESWWRRFMWLKAITTVAAEQGLDEDAAWEAARHACGSVCLARGRDWWRRGKWQPALAEASTDRPRRTRLDDVDAEAVEQQLAPEIAAEVEILREGLAAAVQAQTRLACHVQRRASLHITLRALAVALVTRDGSISGRDLAVAARLDRKTIRTALATAVGFGLLVQTHTYAGGASDCAGYGVGPAALDHIAAARENAGHDQLSPTRCTTPAPTHGRANRARLHREFRAERRRWNLRCDALAALAPGERLATSQHPAARLLRSLHHQRRWWDSLTPSEQEARRAQRQALLRGLPAVDRSNWFTWLARRETITNAADALLTYRADEGGLHALLTAPLTAHRGMRDPRWRDGGTVVVAA